MRFPDLLSKINALEAQVRLLSHDLSYCVGAIQDIKVSLVRVFPEAQQWFRDALSESDPETVVPQQISGQMTIDEAKEG